MPGLWSNAVCLTVIWFLSWSLGPGGAQIWTDEVSGVQYGRLNSNVTLSCGKSQFRLPVFWRLNNSSALPWHQVTSDGRLVLLHVNQSAQGDYSCYDTSGLLVHFVTLRLGHAPGSLIFDCRLPNHTYILCSWSHSVKTFLPAKFNASFKFGKEFKPCILEDARRHCEANDPPLWGYGNYLRITETNVLGSHTSITGLRFFHLLKPDPPEAVMAKEVEGSPQKLAVSCSPPSSWGPSKSFPPFFHIQYRPEGSNHWSNITGMNCSQVIPDAQAGKMYQVRVRVRDEINKESQWSDWSPPVLVRPWEVLTTPEPTERQDDLETVTAESHGSHDLEEEDGDVGLVILLVIFSVIIFTAIISLIFAMWLRQKRRNEASKQELTSMVKMKSMPI